MSIKEYLENLELHEEMKEHYETLYPPLTMRLDRSYYAFLIALAKKYNTSKSAMAADLLTEAIRESMAYVGEDETSKMLATGHKVLDSTKRKKGKN